MFCFVLIMIAATNLALGYAVATHFGFGPKPIGEIDAARARAAAAVPTFSIRNGEGNETPIDELLPAEPITRKTPPAEPRASEAPTDTATRVEPSSAHDDDYAITSQEVGLLAAEMAEATEDVTDSAEHVSDEAEEVSSS